MGRRSGVRQIISKKRGWIGYGIYTVLITGWLMYHLFPAETFGNYVRAKVTETNPKLKLSLSGTGLSFPLTLRFIHVHLFVEGQPHAPVFSAEQVAIALHIGACLQGSPGFRFQGLAYGGEFKGSLQFQNADLVGPFTGEADFKDVDIGKYRYLSQAMSVPGGQILDPGEISGRGSGHIQYRGQGRWMEGSGDVEVNLTQGRMGFLEPVLGLRSFNFDALSGKILLREEKMKIQDVRFKGSALKGRLSGDIFLRRDFAASSLRIRGVIEALQQGLRGLKRPFVIHGTFRTPVFRFG